MDEVVPPIVKKRSSRKRSSTPKKPASGKKKPRTSSTGTKEKRTPPATTASGPTSVGDALQVFEDQRQVAALLSHAIATIRTDFVAHGAEPRLVLESVDGLKRPADTDAIIAATSAINGLVSAAREQAGELLRRPLVQAGPAEDRPHDEQRGGVLDLVRLDAVPNPKNQKKKEGS